MFNQAISTVMYKARRTARKVESVVRRMPPHGPFRDKDGDYHSWVQENGMLYVVTPPEGQMANDYARYMALNMDGVKATVSGVECHCDACGGTGKFGPRGKCYQCNGKGWKSPIDLLMNDQYKRKIAAKKAAETRKKRKQREADKAA